MTIPISRSSPVLFFGLSNFKTMKHLFIFIISALVTVNTNAQNSLSGKITDPKAGPLEGAVVYIPDLKVGAATKADGTYQIYNLPKGTFLLEVRYLGYSHNTQTVKVDGATTFDAVMESSAVQEDEVVVTGNSLARAADQTPQQTSEISNQDLAENSATNVIDAISKAPGVSAMTDGQSISKPVIRGLGYNRVLTVNDGVVQQDQAWFDEFGIEADPDAVDRAEILKGPASLAYGSDGIAGVVNLIPERPLPEGQIKADIKSNYQSNNGLVNTALHIAGTNNGISWSARVDYTMAHAYQNAYDGYAINTQFNNLNADGTIGLHRKWGYTQVHASYFELQTGILDGTRDSLGNQLMPVAYPGVDGGGGPGQPFYILPTNQQAKSYTPFVINQRIRHTKVVWDNSFAVGKGRITALFSWQRNQRQETNDPTMPNTPDIYYFSDAATYDLRYISQNYKGFDFSVGANGSYQASKSLGTLQLIPNYNIAQIGGFFIGNYKYKNLTLSGGVRYDVRLFKGGDTWVDSTQVPTSANTPGAVHEFQGFSTTFSGVSASLGATYTFPHDLYLKGNVARGFRAPNVAECAANGVHDGTVVWELGDHTLKPETSLEGDLAFGMNHKEVVFEIDGFVNSISDFIYAKNLLGVDGTDSINNTFYNVGLGGAPVYQYAQAKALLYGGEALLDIHPTAAQWFDFKTSVSIVQGGLIGVPDSIHTLPFMPPTRIIADIKINLNKIGIKNPMDKVIKNSYIKFGVLACMQQAQVYQQYAIYNGLSNSDPAFQASKAATPGYAIFNLGAGGDLQTSKGHTFAKLYFVVNNLFNTTYMDYMNRFKYYPVNPVTGRVGVFNMGRNFSIKVIIPINIKG
jgi:iron complex outermembrane receptor protein